MVKVNGRYPITLEFLEKLVGSRSLKLAIRARTGFQFNHRTLFQEITQLNSDEESDAVKTVVKKLCDLLHDYQLASLSEEEKEVSSSGEL